MKIGIVTTWFERGAAYVSKQYIEALQQDSSNEIYIYARGGESQSKDDKVWNKGNATWGSTKWGKEMNEEDGEGLLLSFKNWILNNKLDVVFFNEEHWWKAVLLASDLGVKIGSYIDYYTKETVKFYGLYDFIICNTKKHLSAFNWHPQTFYVPWGTDINIFKPKNNGLIEDGKITFFHSAGMNPKRKGTDILINVFYRLKKDNVKLVIHSQKKLKEFFPSLKNIIEELEKKKRIVLYEETVSAPGLYYLGDIYVYPTILEGIGLTIAEALASGLPVIVTDNAPMNEFVNDNVGKLIKFKKFYRRDDDYFWPMCEPDENSLIEAMRYYCDNITQVPVFKEKARKYAELFLDWHKNGADIPKIFATTKILKHARKKEIIDKIVKYEEMKKSKFRRFVHKVKILKLRFIPFAFRFLGKKLLNI